jgi:hypothetical protein
MGDKAQRAISQPFSGRPWTKRRSGRRQLIVARLLSRAFTGTNRQFVAPTVFYDATPPSADYQTLHDISGVILAMCKA